MILLCNHLFINVLQYPLFCVVKAPILQCKTGAFTMSNNLFLFFNTTFSLNDGICYHFLT